MDSKIRQLPYEGSQGSSFLFLHGFRHLNLNKLLIDTGLLNDLMDVLRKVVV